MRTVAHTKWVHGCGTGLQRGTHFKLQASALQLTASLSLSPSSKLCPVSWGRVILGRSGGPGCNVFVYAKNEFVFLFFIFFLLFLPKEVHFSGVSGSVWAGHEFQGNSVTCPGL